MSNWLTALGSLLRRDRVATGTLTTERLNTYNLFDGYYHNTVFDAVSSGGQRDQINAVLGNGYATDLAGLYNPVDRVVDLYLHVFGGQFGTDIRIEAENIRIEEPITKIWRWSNINIAKQPLCRMAANHGTVGLRIVARDAVDLASRRVYIKPEHPKVIRDADMDDRGNVRQILLEYDYTYGDLSDRTTVTIRELMTKDRIQTWRVQGASEIPFDMALNQDNGPGADIENVLGVVPYVLLAHMPGDPWGYNAYYKALPLINRLNALATHINIQIHQHVRAVWLVAAAGQAPVEFDLSGQKIVYVNTQNTASPPLMVPMVANLSLADAITQSKALLTELEDKLPELKATGGEFLSNQSGETVAELRKPAEDKLGLARTNYEDALMRAQQIALSWGILLDLWNLGTGRGTREAADRAFQSGKEDHSFNTRPLLPITKQERNAIAAGLGDDVSRQERLRVRGYSDDQIEDLEKERVAEAEEAIRHAQAMMPPQGGADDDPESLRLRGAASPTDRRTP